jgi:hypothetical protein
MLRQCLPALCLLISSCYPYSTAPELCDQIPEGGCPTGRGGTCDDPLCEALYDCIDGSWQKTEACKGTSSGGGGSAMSTAGSGGSSGAGGCAQGTGGTGGSGGCTPVMLDHTGELVGCMPDLQFPDCPAAAAEQCAESACLTGCDGFFVCTEDGWTEVAYCDTETCALIVSSP